MIIVRKPAEEAPCQRACPAGIDVPRYVRLISEGKFHEALSVVRERIPFPSVCSHICFHPCEQRCRLNDVDGPVAINALKRFVVEQAMRSTHEMLTTKSTGKCVAIIGSGPAGLTTAYYLSKLGHSVTIFEALDKVGGCLRTGVPRFMLPEEVLQQEIHTILSVGVELKLNSPVRNFNELIDDGYDAVLIAIGLSQGKKLAVPGNDFKGVLVGTEFLRCVNLGETVKVGKKVLVLGGGGVACDVALTARRLADSEVHVACLESRKAMPALPWEIEEAENEGVVIHPLQYFNRIVGDSGRATGVECLDLRWMKFDKNGSLHVDPITGSEHILEADTIILAIGQTLDLRLISDFPKIEITQRRTIVVDPDTMETGHLGVFASGDAVSGPASVIEAIAGGRKAASSIDKYLHGKGVIDEVLAPPEQVVIPLPPSLPIGERVSIPILPLEERLASFAKVELCLTEEMAIMEAKRCLRCDLPIIADPAKCTGCLICELRCSLRFEHTFAPLKAKIKIQRLIMADNEFEISFTDDCDGCGICVRYCPYEALARGQERRGLP